MISPMLIYWITRLDDIAYFLGAFAGTLAIISLISLICWIAGTIGVNKTLAKFTKRIFLCCLPVALIFAVVTPFVPTTKEMILIYSLPKIINIAENNKQIMQLPDNLLKFVNQWLIENTTDKK